MDGYASSLLSFPHECSHPLLSRVAVSILSGFSFATWGCNQTTSTPLFFSFLELHEDAFLKLYVMCMLVHPTALPTAFLHSDGLGLLSTREEAPFHPENARPGSKQNDANPCSPLVLVRMGSMSLITA